MPLTSPAAANRDEDRVQRRLPLAQDLHADRSLARDDVGIVVRMNEGRARALLQRLRLVVGVRIRIAVQHDFRAARLDGGDLDVRGRDRHDDRRRAAQPLRRQRHPLCVVARRRRDDALRALGGGELRHLVVGAAQLEREHALLVLALQQHAIAEPARQRGRELERGLDGDVVDLGGQDLLQVVDGHRKGRANADGQASKRSRPRRHEPAQPASRLPGAEVREFRRFDVLAAARGAKPPAQRHGDPLRSGLRLGRDAEAA